MFKTKAQITLLLLVTMLSSGLCETNWSYRNHVDILYSLKDDLIIGLKTKVWFNGIINDINSYHLEIGLDKNVNSWVTISPYCRYIISYTSQDTEIEYRPQIDFTISGRYKRFIIQSRNRIEYRIKTDDTSTRYRNKLLIKYPLGNIVLSIADEPYIDCAKLQYNKNRFYLNLSTPINKRLFTELSYMLEHNKIGKEWVKINLIVTALKLKL